MHAYAIPLGIKDNLAKGNLTELFVSLVLHDVSQLMASGEL